MNDTLFNQSLHKHKTCLQSMKHRIHQITPRRRPNTKHRRVAQPAPELLGPFAVLISKKRISHSHATHSFVVGLSAAPTCAPNTCVLQRARERKGERDKILQYLRMVRIGRMIGILGRLRDGRGVDVVASLGVAGVHVLGWRAAGLL